MPKILTAYADLEIHPDGTKKCDGISIMLMPSTLEQINFMGSGGSCLVNCSVEEAEKLISDLTKVVAHSKKFCK